MATRGVKKGSKRGSYKKSSSLTDFYNAYVKQFETTKKRLEKQSMSQAGLRRTKQSEWLTNVQKKDYHDFIRDFSDELSKKSKNESQLNLAKRLAKEQVTNVDKGLMKSIEEAYKHGELFKGTDLTLDQIKYKIRFDTDFRNDYFDKINEFYHDLRAQGVSYEDAQKKISQVYFGSL